MVKHFAATAYIVALINGQPKVLLHKHKKLGLWLAIGGHVEANENTVECVHREVREEANISIILMGEQRNIHTDEVTEILAPVAILEEKIPAHNTVPEHIHVDNIYFAYTTEVEKVFMEEEHAWFSRSDLTESLNAEVVLLAQEALEAAERYLHR